MSYTGQRQQTRHHESLLSLPVGQNYELLKSLAEHVGFDQADALRLRLDSDYLARLRRFHQDGGILAEELPETERAIEAILGRDGYYGIRDWSRDWWLFLLDDSKVDFPKFPSSLSILDEKCRFYPDKLVRDTHCLFLGVDISCYGWEDYLCKRGVTGRYDKPLIVSSSYSLGMTAHLQNCHYAWYLMLEGAVPSSAGKTLEEQLALLPHGYRLPSMMEMLTHRALYFAKEGELFSADNDAASFRCLDEPGMTFDPKQDSWGISISFDKKTAAPKITAQHFYKPEGETTLSTAISACRILGQ